jgi:hypothetical protein
MIAIATMHEQLSPLKRRIESSVSYPPRKIRRIVSSLPQRLSDDGDTCGNSLDDVKKDVNPQEYLMERLKSNGSIVKISSSLAVEGFFSDFTEEEMSTYNHDVLSAIRSQDIDKLREFHQSGRPLKCSNAFGESLLHMACRRGFVDVATFLIKEAGVTVRVRDDFGRTPMHDACWTVEPNFELLELVMTACPDLLFMSDRRGNTPLEYARRQHWGAYNNFLGERHDLLVAHFQSELKQ